MKQMTNKTCPQCGTEFTCNVTNGDATCWCFDLPNVIILDAIDPPTDCLCPTCLQAKINTQLTTEKPSHS